MSQSLNNMFVEVLSGSVCSHVDLKYVFRKCYSSDSLGKVKALGIILAIGNKNQKTKAFRTLEEILSAGRIHSVEWEFTLIVILLQLRKSLHFTLPLRDFVMHASESAHAELRCNAAIILADIAKNDVVAKKTLERLTRDNDESVRHNAMTLLASL